MLKPNNEFEQNVFEEFKKKTADLNQHELTLIRFLKARDYNIDKAETMLRESIAWREANNIDNILKWEVPKYLEDDMPYRITGSDNEGGPVMWVPLGRWNARQWIEKGNAEEILRWSWYFIEHGLETAKQNCNENCQATVILGMEELSYYKVSHMESMKTLYAGFKVLEQCYPEVLKRVIVINAPWIFSIPFNFVKGILSAHTQSKIKVFGTDKNEWGPYLMETAPMKSLPSCYFQDENGNQ